MESILILALIGLLVQMSIEYGVIGFIIGTLLLFLSSKFPKFIMGLCSIIFLSVFVIMYYYGDKTQDDVDVSTLINQGQHIQAGIVLQRIDKNTEINDLRSLSEEHKGIQFSKYKDHYWGEPSAIMKGYSIHGSTLSDKVCNKLNKRIGLTILPDNSERLSNDKLVGKYGCSSTKQIFFNVGEFYK